MTKRKLHYAVAGSVSVGLMRCELCHKKIKSGQFRYWLSRKGTAYLSEHRACTADDPVWARMDSIDKHNAEWEALPSGAVAWAVWMPGEAKPRQVLLNEPAAHAKIEEFAEAYAGAMVVPLMFKEEDDGD